MVLVKRGSRLQFRRQTEAVASEGGDAIGARVAVVIQIASHLGRIRQSGLVAENRAHLPAAHDLARCQRQRLAVVELPDPAQHKAMARIVHAAGAVATVALRVEQHLAVVGAGNDRGGVGHVVNHMAERVRHHALEVVGHPLLQLDEAAVVERIRRALELQDAAEGRHRPDLSRRVAQASVAGIAIHRHAAAGRERKHRGRRRAQINVARPLQVVAFHELPAHRDREVVGARSLASRPARRTSCSDTTAYRRR